MEEESDHLANLINKDWANMDENMLIPAGNIDLNLIREKLASAIGNMLQSNFERLCQAMYRLDVSEAKFHLILTEKPSEEIPYALADLVIERELQKVRTRAMYKRNEL